MIRTTLPIGTWVRTRYHGGWEYGKLVKFTDDNKTKAIGIQLGIPPPGTMVQTCVWKGDCLEPRGKPRPCNQISSDWNPTLSRDTNEPI